MTWFCSHHDNNKVVCRTIFALWGPQLIINKIIFSKDWDVILLSLKRYTVHKAPTLVAPDVLGHTLISLRFCHLPLHQFVLNLLSIGVVMNLPNLHVYEIFFFFAAFIIMC